MTAIYVGSDNGPEADERVFVCLRARADGYAATCGQLDHCPSCQLCANVHADDCPERTPAVTTPQIPTPAPQPQPVGQPIVPVDFFRRMPGGGTVFIKPPTAPSDTETGQADDRDPINTSLARRFITGQRDQAKNTIRTVNALCKAAES